MANSSQQARNVDGAFNIDSREMLTGSVLLIDDMVDSRVKTPKNDQNEAQQLSFP